MTIVDVAELPEDLDETNVFSDSDTDETLSALEDSFDVEDDDLMRNEEHEGVHDLRELLLDSGSSHSFCDRLLKLLRDKFNCPLPRTYRSFVAQKKKEHPIREVTNGAVLHLGIEKGLQKTCKRLKEEGAVRRVSEGLL